MEKKEIIESLDRLIGQIEVLKAESGPKGNDFIKWVREVKQFIEKAFGAEHPQLRAFKKIDYYPKQFDILSSESSFKKAWMEGLDTAESILEELRDGVAGSSASKKGQDAEPKEEKRQESAGRGEHGVEEITAPVQEKQNPVEAQAPVKEAYGAKNKKEDKKAVPEKQEQSSGKKILLVNISDAKLNEDIFKFIKKMGYEPVVVDQNTESDVFGSNILNSSMYGNPIFAIIHWKGETECDGKRYPTPYTIFSTGYYVAKLTSKRVLIISYEDINWYDDNYSGLNFMGVDNIQELMELKLAREMDAAGLNIDFNFLKKK